MKTYSDEIIDDIRSEFGDSAISKITPNSKKEIKEAIAVYDAMTKDEQNAIAYLKENNFSELQALYKRVKERAGI